MATGALHAFRVQFSHVRVFSYSRNVQKRATKSDTSGHCLLPLAISPPSLSLPTPPIPSPPLSCAAIMCRYSAPRTDWRGVQLIGWAMPLSLAGQLWDGPAGVLTLRGQAIQQESRDAEPWTGPRPRKAPRAGAWFPGNLCLDEGDAP